MFLNPRGHEPRAGASIPGYAGVIPGKYAGNVFAKRFATANIHGTQVRHDNHNGLEWSTNWIIHSVNDKNSCAHGAGHLGEDWASKTLSGTAEHGNKFNHTRLGVTRRTTEP